MPEVTFSLKRALASEDTRRRVERFVRRRVPASEVDDIVQTVLVDALTASSPPEDEGAFRRWLMGVARHKVADHHRSKKRQPTTAELGEHIEGDRPPLDARDLSRWAARQTEGREDDERTLEWMAREGAGEKLAHIAEDEAVPATMVRQRVSRLRRFMRARWKEELAAVAIVTGIILWWQLRHEPEPRVVVPTPDVVDPDTLRDQRVTELRERALAACAAERWDACEKGLDAAAGLDASSDARTDVQQAREAIGRARAPKPSPSAVPTSTQTTAPTKPAPLKQVSPKKDAVVPKRPSPKKPSMPSDFPLKGGNADAGTKNAAPPPPSSPPPVPPQIQPQTPQERKRKK